MAPRTKTSDYIKGTTALETFSVILPSFFYTFIICLITSVFIKKVKRTFHVQRFILEFIFIVIPIILNVTVLTPYISQILVSLFVTTISIYIILIKRKPNETQEYSKKKLDNTKYAFITLSRSTINLISVIGILAVDFTVFPKRFAKTTEYGYSLMDVGVGLFVFSNGIVAPELRGHKSSFLKTIKSIIPLICLGGGRFFLTKQTDYYVPVSEYGVHWNFFITLAVTKVLSSLILNFISVKHAIFSGISLLLAHEIFLQLGLAEYVFSNIPRNNFVSANREGIVSALGYVGLYYLSVAFGRFVTIKNSDSKSKWKHFLKLLMVSCFLLWATFIIEENFGISRRLANSGYCIWIMYIGVTMTSLFYFSELVFEHLFDGFIKVPIIFEAINYNGLIFFLFGNILTGLININIETSKVNTIWSIVIIAEYMFLNCSITYLLLVKQMKMKL